MGISQIFQSLLEKEPQSAGANFFIKASSLIKLGQKLRILPFNKKHRNSQKTKLETF